MAEAQRQLLLDDRAVERTLARMAREVVELNEGVADLAIVGIQRRGVHLAARIADEIERAEGVRPPVGSLDITLYRDDLTAIGPRPVLGETRLPPAGVDGKRVVIVDDVCYTGRTVRAALDELADFGRPSRIALCVLVDRGGRELPIQPDIVGRHVETMGNQRVDVLVPELDGRLAVELSTRPEATE
ncbi:MAG TPA: bifunctional pyr operon transcriptional regulator/uracil phosphoribosyltransferase PyrR [Longimicrobiales bacterium]|nr:bifunctional pyr operon transcriptional regulator/uracil phosphoribosyltransferase PyrR [Longimicrobiales bacterium]